MDIRDLPHNSAPPRSRAPYRCALERSRAAIDSEIEAISETHAGPEWDDADVQHVGAM